MDRSQADEVLQLFRSVFMGTDRASSWAWNGMNDKSAFFDAIVQVLGYEDGFQFLALAQPSIATISEKPGHWAVVCVAAIDSYFHLKRPEEPVAIRSAA